MSVEYVAALFSTGAIVGFATCATLGFARWAVQKAVSLFKELIK